MKERNKEPAKRISENFKGVGELSDADVDRRAREIAVINERPNNEPNESDWQQAIEELIHPTLTPPANDEELSIESASNYEEPTIIKKQSPYKEDIQISETLVKEGVEEAEHDTALKAHEDQRDGE